jgi:hypothetical protein
MKLLSIIGLSCLFIILTNAGYSQTTTSQVGTTSDTIQNAQSTPYLINLKKTGVTALKIKKSDLTKNATFTTNLGRVYDYGVGFKTSKEIQGSPTLPKSGSDRNVFYQLSKSTGTTKTTNVGNLPPHPAAQMITQLMIGDVIYLKVYNVEFTLIE